MKAALALTLALAACGTAPPGKTVDFDLAHATTPETWFDYPFPSELRVDAGHAPDLSAFPNPGASAELASLLSLVPYRRGFPVMPVGYFRFTEPLVFAPSLDQVMTAGPVWLVDIDPLSPQRGTAVPVVAQVLNADTLVPTNVLAVAPRPGLVLHGSREYAYVIGALDPDLARPPAFDEGDPTFTDLWPALATLGVARGDVVAATVFKTGDEVFRMSTRAETLRSAAHAALAHVAAASTQDPAVCTLTAQIDLPQYRTPSGIFALDDHGFPVQQGTRTADVTLTLPDEAMPAAGWPLLLSTGDNDPTAIAALHHLVTATATLPPPATDATPATVPSQFEQGVIEQRILLDALLALQVPQATVAACAGLTASGGVHSFAPAPIAVVGSGTGAVYANMLGAVDPRVGAVVAASAGAMWNNDDGERDRLAAALGIDIAQLSFVHPAMTVIELAWEPAEPMAYMRRLARDPLPGMPTRAIYQPAGARDAAVSQATFDAAALAYGHRQAGAALWPTMQDALALDHLDGVVAYPAPTSAVVQVDGDQVLRDDPGVGHQAGCFLEGFARAGSATIPAPAAIDAPCP